MFCLFDLFPKLELSPTSVLLLSNPKPGDRLPTCLNKTCRDTTKSGKKIQTQVEAFRDYFAK